MADDGACTGAGQGSMCSTGQISVANACMQHSAMQDGNVAFGSAEVGDTGLQHKTMHEWPAAGVG
jgi:hypothetical protein